MKHAQTECALVLEIASRLKFRVFEFVNFVAGVEACPGLNVFRENWHRLEHAGGRKSAEGEVSELIGVCGEMSRCKDCQEEAYWCQSRKDDVFRVPSEPWAGA